MTPIQSVLPAITPVLPEIILSVGALLLVLYGAWRGERSSEGVNVGALILLIFTFFLVVSQSGSVTTLNGAFIADPFARIMKALILIGSAATILLSRDYFQRERIDRFEYPILIVLCTVGMLVMASANDLISLYLGLELQSLAAYVIAAFHRDDVKSTEAGLKYFVLGALSSGMLLYGASLVYGFTGTVSFPGIVTALDGPSSFGIVLGIVFVAAGVAFKLAAVPFHMWTPDVYEGSPTPVTAFFGSAPKIAAMAMTVRVFIGAFPDVTAVWQQIIIFVSIASMALGSFAAIGQRNIKRLMAYSSIGNVGYALIGLAAGSEEGIRGVVIYMIIYLAMTLGAFAVLLSMRRKDQMFETIDDLSGLSRTHPWLAFCLAAMMFSLAGIPPLAGFFAKFYVFAAAIKAGLVTLAVVGVVTSVVGAFYYLRLVKVMYFDEAKAPYERIPPGSAIVLGVSSAVVVLFFLVPAPLVAAAGDAAKSLF
ncbi:MAG: NADH-quinone oxidoreductase subunit NuoN [Methylobacteriaceae bacterium]|jgi:NADH-quinone oxidoreductase subunit N|uniref:NADH-quinone oxidoreductase subunit N n=5 Tax=Methylorubrum extorquens TaxID=408 RepID=C5AWD5_METEA|nr:MULTISPECIES: NADH-quinone oxidoreductase subunit NuoN [Methylobacteriaceae]KQO88774.1 NADH:ubiquinone oxidoreductase subunit N [Methylobacterium sp. Leaf92]KQO91091.1 NADH:ubiquinone oxidoreductase subunit N [Methylobacterium sp. Leaf90]KQP89701.1 NADH:ubiquinone oxidoreductase subunit N [Methylobacterium sp. Leaf119]KQQ06496.1 NADH:ubiquinone oxidoreductase subunit N [Methylobacterium sp. Leaf121]MBA9070631.1 NADH-quinone oxidoreductase subunit N [Methylobacterium sp. RAS18]